MEPKGVLTEELLHVDTADWLAKRGQLVILDPGDTRVSVNISLIKAMVPTTRSNKRVARKSEARAQ